MGSSNNLTDGFESIGATSEEDLEVQLVLALQAPPVNFSIEEIQPYELMTDEQLCWGVSLHLHAKGYLKQPPLVRA
jgi:hypothetical protein